MLFDQPYFFAELAVAILSGIVLYIRGVINTMNRHIAESVSEPRVRELINEKLEAITTEMDHTDKRIDRIEEHLDRIEDKLDQVLLRAFNSKT